jgi:hypothetical protein
MASASWTPNLTWLAPDLAVGGSFPAAGIPHLADGLRVAAVIDLRREDRDDEAALARHGIAFLHCPTNDHGALQPDAIADGLAFAARAAAEGRRLLVHCEHGIGRSATLALCILVERGVDPLAALRHAKDLRPLVSPSPAQYECWTAWLRAHPTRPAVPDFDSFKAVAYRHLAAC